MDFSLNIRSDVAAYVQIENQVKFAIATGDLKEGDQLPAVLKLAKQIDLNLNTVAKAYRDLEVMGLIYTRRGMGCYVAKGVQDRCKKECRLELVRKLYEISQEAKASGMSKKNVTDIISKSLVTNSTPYGEVPASVSALVKKM